MQYFEIIEGVARLVATVAGAGSAVLFFALTLRRLRSERRGKGPLRFKRPDPDDEIPM